MARRRGACAVPYAGAGAGIDVSISARPVLVTGGSGFLGSRLAAALAGRGREVRLLARSRPQSIRGLDVVCGDIADRETVRKAVAGVGLIFHLAAEKSVDFSEREPSRALRTNVFGTLNLVEAAVGAGAYRIVAASSDKASEPRSILGVTKFLMERILCGSDGLVSTAVRLGNVFGSTGSVVDLWSHQLPTGMIEVTDPEMTRFVMSPQEAVDALLDAADRSTTREIVAPALPAYRLGDLAEVFARRHSVRIAYVGPRPGEQRDEWLVSDLEAAFARRENSYFVITPGHAQAGVDAYSSRGAPRLGPRQLAAMIAGEYAVA
jgi:UDP-N-acetylglucosamine 4,6-dehydratase/5-epimerase